MLEEKEKTKMKGDPGRYHWFFCLFFVAYYRNTQVLHQKFREEIANLWWKKLSAFVHFPFPNSKNIYKVTINFFTPLSEVLREEKNTWQITFSLCLKSIKEQKESGRSSQLKFSKPVRITWECKNNVHCFWRNKELEKKKRGLYTHV